MKTTLRKDALTETYNDMQNLICEVVLRFIEKYGGEFEELKAEANLLYTLAFDSYQETKACLSTWLYFRIWKGLLDFRQEETPHQHNHISLEDVPSDQLATKNKPFLYISEILEEVSSDSKTIIKMAFDPPEGLLEEDSRLGFGKRRTRAYIKKYLSFNLHWEVKRIKNAFEEIRNVLTN